MDLSDVEKEKRKEKRKKKKKRKKKPVLFPLVSLWLKVVSANKVKLHR